MNLRDVFAYLFDVKDVLVSKLNKGTNVIQVQLGDSTAEVPDSDAAEWWQHTGFASMPAVPNKGGASCQSLVIVRGDRDVAFASRDTRGSAIYGALKPGETCAYASSGQARTLWKANGSITHLTTSDNTPGGQTIAETLGPDGYHLTTPFGGLSIDANGITLTTGQAALTLSPSGVAKLLGQQVSVSGQAVAVSGAVQTAIGPACTATSKAVFGPLPGGISATVLISP